MTDIMVTEDACRMRTSEILAELKSLNLRLFYDNGSKSLQTRVNENCEVTGAIKRFIWAIVVAGIGSAVAGVFAIVRIYMIWCTPS